MVINPSLVDNICILQTRLLSIVWHNMAPRSIWQQQWSHICPLIVPGFSATHFVIYLSIHLCLKLYGFVFFSVVWLHVFCLCRWLNIVVMIHVITCAIFMLLAESVVSYVLLSLEIERVGSNWRHQWVAICHTRHFSAGWWQTCWKFHWHVWTGSQQFTGLVYLFSVSRLHSTVCCLGQGIISAYVGVSTWLRHYCQWNSLF